MDGFQDLRDASLKYTVSHDHDQSASGAKARIFHSDDWLPANDNYFLRTMCTTLWAGSFYPSIHGITCVIKNS